MTDKTKKKNLILVKDDVMDIRSMEPSIPWYFCHTESFIEEDGMVVSLGKFFKLCVQYNN